MAENTPVSGRPNDPANVKEQAMKRLSKLVANLFGKDVDNSAKFLAGIVAAESDYGQHPNTNRKGYYGGPWQVNEVAFRATQDLKSHPGLAKYHEMFRKKYGVDWMTVKWSQLRNPFFSASAARLYHLTKPKAIPSTRLGRAKAWKDEHNTKAGKGTVERYLESSDPNMSSVDFFQKARNLV